MPSAILKTSALSILVATIGQVLRDPPCAIRARLLPVPDDGSTADVWVHRIYTHRGVDLHRYYARFLLCGRDRFQVRWVGVPCTLQAQMIDLMVTGKMRRDPTDLCKGRDFIITREGDGIDTRYSVKLDKPGTRVGDAHTRALVLQLNSLLSEDLIPPDDE